MHTLHFHMVELHKLDPQHAVLKTNLFFYCSFKKKKIHITYLDSLNYFLTFSQMLRSSLYVYVQVIQIIVSD